MRDPAELPPQTRGLTAIIGAMSLIAVLLMVQVWLLSATLESFLRGNMGTSIPAAIFSGLIFFVCLGLYLFVDRSTQMFAVALQKDSQPGTITALSCALLLTSFCRRSSLLRVITPVQRLRTWLAEFRTLRVTSGN